MSVETEIRDLLKENRSLLQSLNKKFGGTERRDGGTAASGTTPGADMEVSIQKKDIDEIASAIAFQLRQPLQNMAAGGGESAGSSGGSVSPAEAAAEARQAMNSITPNIKSFDEKLRVALSIHDNVREGILRNLNLELGFLQTKIGDFVEELVSGEKALDYFQDGLRDQTRNTSRGFGDLFDSITHDMKLTSEGFYATGQSFSATIKSIENDLEAGFATYNYFNGSLYEYGEALRSQRRLLLEEMGENNLYSRFNYEEQNLLLNKALSESVRQGRFQSLESTEIRRMARASGQNLSIIAKMTGRSVDELVRLNATNEELDNTLIRSGLNEQQMQRARDLLARFDGTFVAEDISTALKGLEFDNPGFGFRDDPEKLLSGQAAFASEVVRLMVQDGIGFDGDNIDPDEFQRVMNMLATQNLNTNVSSLVSPNAPLSQFNQLIAQTLKDIQTPDRNPAQEAVNRFQAYFDSGPLKAITDMVSGLSGLTIALVANTAALVANTFALIKSSFPNFFSRMGRIRGMSNQKINRLLQMSVTQNKPITRLLLRSQVFMNKSMSVFKSISGLFTGIAGTLAKITGVLAGLFAAFRGIQEIFNIGAQGEKRQNSLENVYGGDSVRAGNTRMLTGGIRFAGAAAMLIPGVNVIAGIYTLVDTLTGGRISQGIAIFLEETFSGMFKWLTEGWSWNPADIANKAKQVILAPFNLIKSFGLSMLKSFTASTEEIDKQNEDLARRHAEVGEERLEIEREINRVYVTGMKHYDVAGSSQGVTLDMAKARQLIVETEARNQSGFTDRELLNALLSQKDISNEMLRALQNMERIQGRSISAAYSTEAQ